MGSKNPLKSRVQVNGYMFSTQQKAMISMQLTDHADLTLLFESFRTFYFTKSCIMSPKEPRGASGVQGKMSMLNFADGKTLSNALSRQL